MLLLPGSGARLVVLAVETGGRWSFEALAFVRLRETQGQKRAAVDAQTGGAGLAVQIVVSVEMHGCSLVCFFTVGVAGVGWF